MKKPSLRNLLMALVWINLGFHAYGQEEIPASKNSKMSIQLQLGTQGPGLALRYAFTPRFAARLGGTVIPVEMADPIDLSTDEIDVSTGVTADFYNTHLLLELSPARNGSIRFAGGLAYFIKNEVEIVATPTGPYQFGEVSIPAENIGNVIVNTSWAQIAPYMGISFGKGIPKKRINVGLDLGLYFIDAPEVQIDATGMLAGNTSNEALFESNMADYNWFPVIQLNINFKL